LFLCIGESQTMNLAATSAPHRDGLAGGNSFSWEFTRPMPVPPPSSPSDAGPAPAVPPLRSRFDGPARSDWREYASVIAVVIALTAAGTQVPESYYTTVGLVFLLAINVMSLRVGRGPILTAGVLLALIWDYRFVKPYYDIGIENLHDALLFIIYLIVALIAGQFTTRIRAQAANERLLQERATALFQFTRDLAEAKTLLEAASAAITQMDELLGARTALALASPTPATHLPRFIGSFFVYERERQVAMLALQQRRPTGRFTDVRLTSEGYYVPLLRGDQAFGVLGVKVGPHDVLTRGQRELLDAFAQQLALIVERDHLRAASEREKLLAASEKLHRALLESVSHELRTPLAVITATTEELAEVNTPEQAELVGEIRAAGQRLNRLVGNLLDQTRLESGALKPHVDWCDTQDIINAALEDTQEAMAGHPLTVQIADEAALVRADFALTEHILSNLLINAAWHTPLGTPVSLTVGIAAEGTRLFFQVADRGPGFPKAMREQLFHKFSRGPAAPVGGLGLGLSIVRGFAAAQGGEVVLDDQPGGGACITLYLSHTVSDNPPPE